MAKKKPPEPQPEPTPETEAKKPAGRTIGAWRKEALRFLGKGASDSDVTEHVMKLAKEGGYEYETNDEETADWRGRVQAEMDGITPAETPRRSRSQPQASEPTLSDLLTVLAQLKETELPDVGGMSPVEGWSLIIGQVEALAARIGGLANLKKCLDVASGLAALAK